MSVVRLLMACACVDRETRRRAARATVDLWQIHSAAATAVVRAQREAETEVWQAWNDRLVRGGFLDAAVAVAEHAANEKEADRLPTPGTVITAALGTQPGDPPGLRNLGLALGAAALAILFRPENPMMQKIAEELLNRPETVRP